MSHFVFGRIYQIEPQEERDQALLFVEQTIRGAGLFGRFGEHICQDIVTEMLSEQAAHGAVLCEFLLTANERDDTSDFIISPYCLKENELGDKLSRVEQWTIDLLRLPAIARLDLYLTEGYDQSFNIMSITDVGWGQKLAKEVFKKSYVESIGIQVSAADPPV
jgi:hypothetical protein